MAWVTFPGQALYEHLFRAYLFLHGDLSEVHLFLPLCGIDFCGVGGCEFGIFCGSGGGKATGKCDWKEGNGTEAVRKVG